MDSDITPEVASRLLEFVDRMDDLVGVCDEHGRVLYMNQTARKHLGVGNATDLTTADLFAPEAFASYYDEVRPALLHSGTWTGELAIHAPGGGSVPMLFSVVAGVGPGGEITGLVTHGRPVPSDPPHRGTSDASDIIEREVLLDRVARALNRRAGSCAAIVYVEVRDMTSLSERHGGLIADGTMRTVGRRLTSIVRASDFVGRVGRNAFFIVFVDTRDAGEAMRLLKSVEDAFDREPIWSVAGEISIRLRCGLALANSGEEPGAALARAQLAAAPSGSVQREDLGPDVTMLAACEALRPAVMQGEVLTFMRTVVDRNGKVVGHTACPRWYHREYGTFDRDALERLAARAGVSTAIALRALREGAAFMMTSPVASGHSIAVVLPESTLQDAYVEQYILEVTDAVGIAPEQIALLVEPGVASPATLRSLRETGARLVARNIGRRDDVLALVADHHFIDMRLSESWVAQITLDQASRRAIRNVMSLAHDVGARVSAPGVTSAAQRDALLDAGVDFLSGDFFGIPVPAESVT